MKKNPENKGLPCCYKGMANEKNKKKSVSEQDKMDNKHDVVDQKVFRFITESKFPMKKMRRLCSTR